MFFDFAPYPRQSFDSPDTAPTILAARAWKPPMRDKALTRVFMGMQLFGWAGYTLIIWTVFLSRKIHKHPVWIMFCLSWLISCVSYVLLFLAGEMDSNEPNHTLCLVQACLIYAVPVLTASATLALIIHLWFNVRTVVFHIETRHARTRDFLLCLFPYIPALCFFFGVLWYALEKPEEVKPGDSCMYCVVGASFPGKASAIYVALILASGVGIEAVIATTLYNNWRSYTRSSRDSFALIIRVVLFTAFGFMSIVSSHLS
ncbi:G-protein coupled receptors family 2 profile 2 domain-containing protein, partial [Pleurotus pulmonarius]